MSLKQQLEIYYLFKTNPNNKKRCEDYNYAISTIIDLLKNPKISKYNSLHQRKAELLYELTVIYADGKNFESGLHHAIECVQTIIATKNPNI